MFSVILSCLMLQISGLIRSSMSLDCNPWVMWKGIYCAERVYLQMEEMAKALKLDRMEDMKEISNKINKEPCLSEETSSLIIDCCRKYPYRFKSCKELDIKIWMVLSELKCNLRRKGIEISAYFPGISPRISATLKCINEFVPMDFPMESKRQKDKSNFDYNYYM